MTINQFFDDFTAIDITRPWMAPYRAIHESICSTIKAKPIDALAPWLDHYFSDAQIAIRHHDSQTALSFTYQSDLPHGIAYEAYIGDTAKIPTRDNLHDWFGACVWSVFPKTKALLNYHHRQQIAIYHHLNDSQGETNQPTKNSRGRVRDALTVFDENGAIVVTSRQDMADALTDFNWQSALVAPYYHWHSYDANMGAKKTQAQCLLFGHALLEQLITPRKPLCAHSVILMVDDEFFHLTEAQKLNRIDDLLMAHLDDWLSGRLTGCPVDKVSPRQLQPLPVLGVPHFWDGQDAQFYADTSVFRAGRKR